MLQPPLHHLKHVQSVKKEIFISLFIKVWFVLGSVLLLVFLGSFESKMKKHLYDLHLRKQNNKLMNPFYLNTGFILFIRVV